MAVSPTIQTQNAIPNLKHSEPHVGTAETCGSLFELTEKYREEVYQQLPQKHRSQMGQFFTPPVIAQFMASFFSEPTSHISLLDSGAGVGALTAAFVEDMLQRECKPNSISVTAFEQEALLEEYLSNTLNLCGSLCIQHDCAWDQTVKQVDFINSAVNFLDIDLFSLLRDGPKVSFNRAILNPPYKKLRSDSEHRHLLRRIGIETSNLYTAFVALAIELLEPDGELVAITPRSFCNGPYFRPFRKRLLESMSLQRIHVFESRGKAFGKDDVLQENIIFHAVKKVESKIRNSPVIISSSDGPKNETMTLRHVAYERIVNPADSDQVIHIATTELDQLVVDRISLFVHALDDLDISVSTGRVVDFRVKEHLRSKPDSETAPLIYPLHFNGGFIDWPATNAKKPNAIVHNEKTKEQLLPSGDYVLVKRFSSKEEKRRIVANFYQQEKMAAHQAVGFENHLNVFHQHDASLPKALAKGLMIYLNSTLVDLYFRQFNGHTQVNATDLRMLKYPSRAILEKWGNCFHDTFLSQREIDQIISEEIAQMAENLSSDPIKAKQKIDDAIHILKALGLPKAQQNERSALTLLGLINLEPEMEWSQASSPPMGITPIMDFIREHYGRNYAPNTRETIRRQSMHQFVQAALALENPDQPDRPVNSPNWCYQIAPSALQLLHQFGTSKWQRGLDAYLVDVPSLQIQYAKQRNMQMIPVSIEEDIEIQLSPGKHSQLIKSIIEEFAPRYSPGGKLLYVGDTGDKWGYFDQSALEKLGVAVDAHGKMPDVVIHFAEKEWILLIEAVTSHGPVDAKRRIELQKLFASAQTGLVYVSAFPSRKDFAKYVAEISWETEVWIQDSPDHLIHWDGERFLGPYDE